MKRRNYNVDLLRCILMVMIVMHHTIVHALGIEKLNQGIVNIPYGDAIIFLLNGFVIVGVNCFFAISGYFGIKFHPKKIGKLLLDMIIYSFACNTFDYFILQGQPLNMIYVKMAIKDIIFPFRWWFMNAYFALCFVAPIINRGLESLEPHELRFAMVSTSLVYFFFGFLLKQSNGYTFIQATYIYSLVRGLKLLGYFDRIKNNKNVLLYILCAFMTGGLSYLLYIRQHGTMSWLIFNYANPLIVIGAISFFSLFVKGNMTGEKNKLAVSCSHISKNVLGVYLISESTNNMVKMIFSPTLHFISNFPYSLLWIIAILINAIVIFIICICIDKLKEALLALIGKSSIIKTLIEKLFRLSFWPKNSY